MICVHVVEPTPSQGQKSGIAGHVRCGRTNVKRHARWPERRMFPPVLALCPRDVNAARLGSWCVLPHNVPHDPSPDGGPISCSPMSWRPPPDLNATVVLVLVFVSFPGWNLSFLADKKNITGPAPVRQPKTRDFGNGSVTVLYRTGVRWCNFQLPVNTEIPRQSAVGICNQTSLSLSIQ